MAKSSITLENVSLNADTLVSLLTRASLEGSIDQCLLEVNGGVGSVVAVDMTNTVFLSVSEKISIPDCKLGLCGVSKIVKILSQGGEFTLSTGDDGKESQNIVLKKKGLGTARFLLMKTSEVPTAVPESEEAISKLTKQCKIAFNLTAKAMDKVSVFTGIFSSEVVRISGKNGTVTFGSPESSGDRFSTPVGNYEGADFTTSVYGGMLMKVLKIAFACGIDEKKGLEITSGDDMPVIVRLNKNNFWAVTSIAQ